MKVEQAMRFAAGLPDVSEAPHFDMWSFRVGGKIFATVPPDNLHLHIFLEPEESTRIAKEDPTAFEQLWWGTRLRGVRVNLPHARAGRVRQLLEAAWRRKAPKRLL